MWKLLLSATLWIGLTLALNRPWTLGKTTLPALGKFFSPGSGFWRNTQAEDINTYNHPLSMSGIGDSVHVVLDERMVPHIFAQNDLDAYYAQGYITAMHRLWQMDLSARASAGELSRILGSRTLSYDKNQRQMGMGFAAKNRVKGWEKYPEDMALIEAYTAGINAYITQLMPNEFPIEYKLMDFSPELWTPSKTAYFVMSMASRLCLDEDDLENTLLLKWLGHERFEALFPEHNPQDDPVIPQGATWDFTPLPIDTSLQQIPALVPNGVGKAIMQKEYREGSNNWALSGTRTASGKPILCNDPHLGLSLPSVWYEVQIITPQQNVYGVSLPGIPGVIIGFNNHISWGITNVGQDVLDWYEIKWTDSTQTAYELDGKVVQAELRIEKIDIKGQASQYDTIKYTHWGPVQKTGEHKGLAMRWLAHDIPDRRESTMFVQLNHAKTHEEFVTALGQLQTPAQNFVFADKLGNIALHIGGKLPLRHNRNGRFVQDGSQSRAGWSGSIPPDQNPGIKNPQRGFVSSANQESTDLTYPYIYHGGFEDFRGRFLNRHLQSVQGATPQQMQALQYNATSLKAEEILPRLLRALPGSMTEAHQLRKDSLAAWNYSYSAASRTAVVFDLWYDAFYRLLWDDFYAKKDSIYIYAPDAWRTNQLVLFDSLSAEYDIDSTSATETFEDIARISFEKAMKIYQDLDAERSTWGGYQETTVRHLASIISFNRVLNNAPGHADVLNARTRSHGPSWRMIVHLTDPVEAYVVYPGGQSGNPGSPYYDMMIDKWEKGEYYTAHYLKSPGDIKPLQVINLKPEGR